MQSQHLAHANGHVGIGGEIQIDVKRIGEDAQPGPQNGQGAQCFQVLCQKGCVCRRTVGKQHRICQGAAGICQQNLFGKTGTEPGHTGSNFRLPGPEQLLFDGLVTDNGAGNALVEQCCVQKHIPIAPLRLRFPPVHIHHIGQQLKGIEGNADGQRDLLHKFGDRPENAADQAGVFEISDQCQHDYSGGRQP